MKIIIKKKLFIRKINYKFYDLSSISKVLSILVVSQFSSPTKTIYILKENSYTYLKKKHNKTKRKEIYT